MNLLEALPKVDMETVQTLRFGRRPSMPSMPGMDQATISVDSDTIDSDMEDISFPDGSFSDADSSLPSTSSEGSEDVRRREGGPEGGLEGSPSEGSGGSGFGGGGVFCGSVSLSEWPATDWGRSGSEASTSGRHSAAQRHEPDPRSGGGYGVRLRDGTAFGAEPQSGFLPVSRPVPAQHSVDPAAGGLDPGGVSVSWDSPETLPGESLGGGPEGSHAGSGASAEAAGGPADPFRDPCDGDDGGNAPELVLRRPEPPRPAAPEPPAPPLETPPQPPPATPPAEDRRERRRVFKIKNPTSVPWPRWALTAFGNSNWLCQFDRHPICQSVLLFPRVGPLVIGSFAETASDVVLDVPGFRGELLYLEAISPDEIGHR